MRIKESVGMQGLSFSLLYAPFYNSIKDSLLG